MTEEQRLLMSDFNRKVLNLVEKYENLLAENKMLRNKIEELESIISDKSSQLSDAEKETQNLRLAQSLIFDKESVEKGRERMAKMVRDIDMCIKLLSSK